MARAVVILGAGASADFGVPTLGSIFKERHARQYVLDHPELRRSLDEIFWKPRGYTLDTADQSLNIEQMLTILRDLESEPGLPAAQKPGGLEAFKRSLYCLIQQAVFVGKSSRGEHLNPLIALTWRAFEQTTWASFNWDCVFESSYWYQQPYRGPGSRSNPRLAVQIANWNQGSDRALFLKLHGGINWWMIGGQLTYLSWTAGGELQTKWAEYAADPKLTDTPVILEPSSYKYHDATFMLLESQWQVFLERLLTADFVIVAGYSLPEGDSYARSKIVTAFQANPNARWLLIDPSDSVCGHYARLLGQQRLTVLRTTLAGFNNDIEANLQAAFPGLNVPDH